MRFHKRHLLVAIPLSVTAVGVALVAAGIAYGALTVGVPAQDPTPAIVDRENFHDDVGRGLFMVGVCIMTLGCISFLLGGMFLAFFRFFDRRLRPYFKPCIPSPGDPE